MSVQRPEPDPPLGETAKQGRLQPNAAALRRVLELEIRATGRAMALPVAHPWLRPIVAGLAHSGDGILWVAVGLASWALSASAGRRIAIQTAAAAALTAGLVALLKFAVRRDRPSAEGSRWSALSKHDRYSFPSGHAARAWCVALSIAWAHPGLWPLVITWAIGVSLARVAVGAHHLLDVVAGAALGVGAGALILWLWTLTMAA